MKTAAEMIREELLKESKTAVFVTDSHLKDIDCMSIEDLNAIFNLLDIVANLEITEDSVYYF
jgi:hypothetical protein